MPKRTENQTAVEKIFLKLKYDNETFEIYPSTKIFW